MMIGIVMEQLVMLTQFVVEEQLEEVVVLKIVQMVSMMMAMVT